MGERTSIPLFYIVVTWKSVAGLLKGAAWGKD